MKFSRSNRISIALAVLALPCAAGFAQLNLPPSDTSALAVREQTVPMDSRLEVETPVYLPESGNYGLLGALALGVLLFTRRIASRSAALAG